MGGKVTLVGAGPGDPKLLTLGAKDAIEKADIVLYDRLVGSGILAMIPSDAECIYVGKHAGNHVAPQNEINKMILSHAKNGKHIVRLKGGDPYLFGRGAEELEDIVDAEIEFEVIPGITSAIAVPAMAGIPVTHRNISSSVHIITAHKKRNEPLDIRFDELAKLDGTLVFLMGVAELDSISSGLINAGMSSKTSVALIMNGTTHRQRKLITTLESLKKDADAGGFSSPCVLVVGEVCKLSDKLDFRGKLLLSGVAVMTTRPRNRSSILSSKLRSLGCEVTELPMIETMTVKMDNTIVQKLPTYDWIVFTSQTGVEAFVENIVQNGLDIRKLSGCKFAVIGRETEKALAKCGVISDFIPDVFDAEHLFDGLKDILLETDKILLYRSAIGRKFLTEKLSQIVQTVDDIPAYTTSSVNCKSEIFSPKVKDNEFDYVLFASGSAVDGFVEMVGDIDLGNVSAICIGEQTANKAGKYGMNVHVSDEVTIDSMIDKLLNLVGEKK